MKTTLIILATAVVFAALLALYPQALINPGPLITGHSQLQKDCLACHKPFRGVASEKCMRCHVPETIGVMSVAGEPLPRPNNRARFHKQLIAADCSACHSDHQGQESARATRGFSHNQLPRATLNRCEGCHDQQRPTDRTHQHVMTPCGSCHTPTGWKPATFDHARLTAAGQGACQSCHAKDRPADALHRDITQNCRQCHSTSRWKPSTFDHRRFFRFDRNHPANCSDCHMTFEDFTQYTCYQCHEHRPAKVAREHREEGIFDFEDCARCHRSGDEHDIRYRGRREESEEHERRRKRREHEEEDEEHEHEREHEFML